MHKDEEHVCRKGERKRGQDESSKKRGQIIDRSEQKRQALGGGNKPNSTLILPRHNSGVVHINKCKNPAQGEQLICVLFAHAHVPLLTKLWK